MSAPDAGPAARGAQYPRVQHSGQFHRAHDPQGYARIPSRILRLQIEIRLELDGIDGGPELAGHEQNPLRRREFLFAGGGALQKRQHRDARNREVSLPRSFKMAGVNRYGLMSVFGGLGFG